MATRTNIPPVRATTVYNNIVDDPVDAAETLNTNLAKIHGWLNLILIKQKV
jgi:hypothetical protein